MTFSDIAKLVANAEITPELSQYWAKRYLRLLDDKYFVLSEKTHDLLLASSGSLAPTTPYGYLDLARFVSSNNQIVDEVTLQNTVETAIRFLDSSLEIVKFTPQSKEIVDKFRKIGLGIMNFKNFLTLRGNPENEMAEIDYLGAIISGSAYRASEALAEEKGVGMDWENVEQILRPKSFEYWYDTETGEISSGLDLSLIFDQSSILESNYKIIPRRNSAILLYPSDVNQWSRWSDRDENLPQATEIQKEVKVLENSESDFDLKNLENILITNSEPESNLEDEMENILENVFAGSESEGAETNSAIKITPQQEAKLDLSRSKIYEADSSQDGKAIPLVSRLIEDGKRKLSEWLNLNHDENVEKANMDEDIEEGDVIDAHLPEVLEFPLPDTSMTDPFLISPSKYTFEPIAENINADTPTLELENEKTWRFDSSGLINDLKSTPTVISTQPKIEKFEVDIDELGFDDMDNTELGFDDHEELENTASQDLIIKNQKQEVEIFKLKAEIKELESEKESQITDWEKLLVQMTDRDKVQKARISELETKINVKPAQSNSSFFNFGGGIKSEPIVAKSKPDLNQVQNQEQGQPKTEVKNPEPKKVYTNIELNSNLNSTQPIHTVPGNASVIDNLETGDKNDDTSLLLRMKRMKR